VNELRKFLHSGAGKSAPAKTPAGPPTDTLDVLVQAATVDLFRDYGLATAPLPKRRGGAGYGNPGDIVGSIRFSAPGATGTLWLILPVEIAKQTRVTARSFEVVDWTRELVNQLMGRLKNRLLRYQLRLNVDLAKAAVRAGKVVYDEGDLYRFRAMRGEIGVVLASSLDPARLVYSAVEVAKEGELVLF
jgi:hypothetical protein